MDTNSLKIALYGGSFDPIHLAHLILAQTAVETLHLDKVIFMPSGGHAHYKTDSNQASGADRLEMIRLSIQGNPCFEASGFEVDQGCFCYTINTLRHLQAAFPAGTEVFLLVGGDWINKIPTWKEGDAILRDFKVALFSRPGYVHDTELPVSARERGLFYVDMPLIDISSSEIRQRIREEKSIRYRVPEAVCNYIQERNLYEKAPLLK